MFFLFDTFTAAGCGAAGPTCLDARGEQRLGGGTEQRLLGGSSGWLGYVGLLGRVGLVGGYAWERCFT